MRWGLLAFIFAAATLTAACGKSAPEGFYRFADGYYVSFSSKPMCKREDINSIVGPTRTVLCASIPAGRRHVAELQSLPEAAKLPSAKMMLMAVELRAANTSESEIVSRQSIKVGGFGASDVTMVAKQGGNVTFARYVLVDHDVITLRADLYDSTEMPADARAFLDSFQLAE